MATELMERTSTPVVETIVLPKAERSSRWPLIAAAAILLAAAVTAGLYLVTRAEPVGSFPELNTAVREGPGSIAEVASPGLYPSLDTPSREGFSTIPAVATGIADPTTAVREGGSLYPEGTTDTSGSGFDPGRFVHHAAAAHQLQNP